MEKGSGAAAGSSARPPPMPQLDEFPFEGKKPVKNPFVPIGTPRARPSLCYGVAGSWIDRSPRPRFGRVLGLAGLLCGFGVTGQISSLFFTMLGQRLLGSLGVDGE